MEQMIFGVAIIAAMAVADGWNFNKSTNEVEVSNNAQFIFLQQTTFKNIINANQYLTLIHLF